MGINTWVYVYRVDIYHIFECGKLHRWMVYNTLDWQTTQVDGIHSRYSFIFPNMANCTSERYTSLIFIQLFSRTTAIPQVNIVIHISYYGKLHRWMLSFIFPNMANCTGECCAQRSPYPGLRLWHCRGRHCNPFAGVSGLRVCSIIVPWMYVTRAEYIYIYMYVNTYTYNWLC